MNANNSSSLPSGAEIGSNNVIASNNNRAPTSSSSRASTNISSARVPHARRFAGSVAGMNARTHTHTHTHSIQSFKSHPPRQTV